MAEGWPEPQLWTWLPTTALTPHPLGRAASLGPISAQSRVCQNTGLACALRARLICRQEYELIRSPASMITWGVSCLPVEAEVEGDPASRHCELSGDREEAGKVEVRKEAELSRQKQKAAICMLAQSAVYILLQTQELLVPQR